MAYNSPEFIIPNGAAAMSKRECLILIGALALLAGLAARPSIRGNSISRPWIDPKSSSKAFEKRLGAVATCCSELTVR